MGDWYPVVKTIKGKKYRYLQQTYRVGGRVYTRNRYLGRIDAGASGTPSGSPIKRPKAPSASVPLFQSPSDFGSAMLKQFDAAQWGKDAGAQLLGSAVSGATTAERRSHNRRPPARFDFNKPVAYDPQAKRRFHLRARRQLRELAAVLGLQSGDYDLRSNQGGIAVSGEVTLHTDHLYVQVSQSVLGDTGILYRHCQGRRDFTGGHNNFAPLDLLNDPDELTRRIRHACLMGAAPLAATAPSETRDANEEFQLPPNRRITDAYPENFLGINMEWLEGQAKEKGYNLYNALITRVDSEDDIGKKVAAIHGILDEILNADPHEPPAIHERSVTTTPVSQAPAPLEVAGKQAPQSGAGSGGYTPRDVQAEITNTIIEAIEGGQANWTFQMPWHAIAGEGVPVNAVTHQPYHGMNVLFLSFEAQQRKWPNQWASFQQWKEHGASVRKGEHGVPIVFYSPVQIQDVEEDAAGNKTFVLKTIPVFRYSTVFNIAQVDNPPPVPTPPTSLVNPIEKAEEFIQATKADIRYGGNRAYFSPAQDYIQIPKREAFTGTKTISPTEAFYSTLLHELCHWTGAKTRLNRDMNNRFGDEAYAAEELVAGIGEAFACAELGITPELREDHVQYVASWLKILKEDKRAIFTASAAAARAVDYLETLQPKT
jgi:antirestriction protein ArdC